MSTFLLYLLLILPSAKATLSTIAGGLLAAIVGYSFIHTLCVVDDHDSLEKIRDIWRHAMKYAPWLIGTFVLLAFIPSLPIILALIGWEIASDAFAPLADLPPKLAEYMNAILDRELAKIIPVPQ